MSQAPLWILDEPFTAIDKKGVEILTALFDEHAQRGGYCIIDQPPRSNQVLICKN